MEDSIHNLLHAFLKNDQSYDDEDCLHINLKTDYMGSTCSDCKKIIAGKGFGGSSKKCIHKYDQDIENIFTCLFCGHQK